MLTEPRLRGAVCCADPDRVRIGVRTRLGYLGPEGTNTHEALLGAVGGNPLAVPLPSVPDTVAAVRDGSVDQALVPIENALEGSVNATLDALVAEGEEVVIVGELIHPIRTCLIGASGLTLGEIEAVTTHPQAAAQCGRFLRSRLAGIPVVTAASTAEAVRSVAERPGWAALGSRLAAERYGCEVLLAEVDDDPGNETRFVWLARRRRDIDTELIPEADGGHQGRGAWKTAVVFWGAGSESSGWLVGCLAEFARRGVNLTRIESRPLRQGLGLYMFFADLEGRRAEPRIEDALAGLRERVEVLRVLGSFPAAA